MTRPRIPWLRVLIEGVVIVGSILLAFGIDAWWEGRQERVEEQALLSRLQGELAEAESHLQEWRENQRGVADAGREILANTELSPRPTIPTDSIGKLIWKATFNWDADPPTGVVSSAIATGRISLIADSDLREALVLWEAAFRRGVERA